MQSTMKRTASEDVDRARTRMSGSPMMVVGVETLEAVPKIITFLEFDSRWDMVE